MESLSNEEKPPVSLCDAKATDSIEAYFPEQIEAKLGDLEKLLCSHVETASDTLNVFAHGARPTEQVITYEAGVDGSANTATLAVCATQRRVLMEADDFLRQLTMDQSGRTAFWILNGEKNGSEVG